MNKSASNFDDASKIVAKSIVTMGLIAMAFQVFSVGDGFICPEANLPSVT